MKCSSCLSQCRSRTSAMVLTTTGLERRLVCAGCAGSGVLIIPPSFVHVPATCKSCGKPPTRCEACATDRQHKPDEIQKTIAKKLRALAKTYAGTAGSESDFNDGRAAGLEQAADLVEAAQRAGA